MASRKTKLLCDKLLELMEEDVLKDTILVFGPSDSGTSGSMKINAFLLSLVSPVLQKMICSTFKEGLEKRLILHNVDQITFLSVLNVACGREVMETRYLKDVIEVGRVAERFQVSDVAAWVEDYVLGFLKVENCAEILMHCQKCGLTRVEERSRAMLLRRFEEVARTEAFMCLSEEMLGSLLEEDKLVSGGEELVLEALLAWMQGGERNLLRGQQLLKTIRFPLMKEEYLIQACSALPGNELLEELTNEALAMKTSFANTATHTTTPHLLNDKAWVNRKEKRVGWEAYAAGGETRLQNTQLVIALALCAGRVCSGSREGVIRVWDRSSLREERRIKAAAGVSSMIEYKGLLIAGHSDGRITVWDVSSGICLATLEEKHLLTVTSLALGPGRLVSGSTDNNVGVWRLSPCPGAGAGPGPGPGLGPGAGVGVEAEVSGWQLERKLRGHCMFVSCVACWEGKALSGSGDETIQVWDMDTGDKEVALRPAAGAVYSMVVEADWLLGSGRDGSVHIWTVGTWEAVRRVQVYTPGSTDYVRCMLVSGGREIKLVMGSFSAYSTRPAEVRVWDMGRMECEHVLGQPPGACVWALLGMEGEVWGGVGKDVVVWGRE